MCQEGLIHGGGRKRLVKRHLWGSWGNAIGLNGHLTPNAWGGIFYHMQNWDWLHSRMILQSLHSKRKVCM